MRASRVSKRTGETFLTRKDRRVFDNQFLKPRERRRRLSPEMIGMTRRAKSIKKDGDYAP